jgi:hypothetical protein
MILLIVKKSLLAIWQTIWQIVRMIFFLNSWGPIITMISVEYRDAVKRLGDQAGDFHEMISRIRYKDRLNLSSLLQEPLRELPMVILVFF